MKRHGINRMIARCCVCTALCIMTASQGLPYSAEIFQSRGRPSVRRITQNADRVERFGLFELTVDLSSSYTNPFDARQIELIAHFVSPSGATIDTPGFFYVPFSRTLEGEREVLTQSGRPCWKVRFTPAETGQYMYTVTLRTGQRNVASKNRSFIVVDSDNPGFVRTSKSSPYYLAFDSGKPYCAIGESIPWVRRHKVTYDYEYYFQKLAQNGCTYSRIWLVEWNLPLEWKDYDMAQGTVHGAGMYSMDNAWRLDHIISEAAHDGIYLLITLDTYGSLKEDRGYWREERWSQNPYNAANGGPCRRPQDFWTNEEARRLYQQRLGYILARWGYAANILAFEFWNEVDTPPEWLEEMVGFVKAHDSSGHLTTTSLGFSLSEKHLYDASRIWHMKGVDFTQTHLYGHDESIKDMAQAVRNDCVFMTGQYQKPHLVAEIGIDYGQDDARLDLEGKGVHLHNSIWASIMSRSFGTAMTHWNGYVDKKDLYFHYRALSRFVKDIDWLAGPWEIVHIDNLASGQRQEPGYADIAVPCSSDWAEDTDREVVIENTGDIFGKVNIYLHGLSKQPIRITPTFVVNFPTDGAMVIDVKGVSQSADLRAYLDDQEVWRHEFGAGPGEGEWKKSQYVPQYDIYQAQYDRQYEIAIPRGRHRIRLENVGKDWISLNQIVFKGCRMTHLPPVRVIGLSKADEAILWIQNMESTWYNEYKKLAVTPQENVSFDVNALADGPYRLEWWDTASGEIIETQTAVSKDSTLTVRVPAFERDIAVKIRKSSS